MKIPNIMPDILKNRVIPMKKYSGEGAETN
jgi:hypothetical protein